MQVLRTLMAAVFIVIVVAGCYSTYHLPPPELSKLDGYREGQKVFLSSVDGEEVPFSSKTSLALQAADGSAVEAKFAAVDVNGPIMQGVIRGSGAPVNIDISQITQARAKNFSTGKTVGLAVGLGVGIPLVLIITIVALSAAAYRSVIY